ncbi:MAG: M14 family metallopeptidase [Bacteroidia bacterium]|nr:M14 family metallopeptidase [Bacteroidia bacterium]
MRGINLLTSSILLVLINSIVSPQQGFAQSSVPKPEEHFGFTPGSDYMLFNYEQLIDYLVKLDKASPMLKLVEIGQSPMGKKMYIAFISSEKNINNLDRLREINRELALNPDLSETKQAEYIKDGKVFFLATLSMHSTEVAPSQASPLIAYKLLTSNDPLIKKYLDDVVYMMVPNHNPDGMDFVVENYNKYRGTQYEGASLPRVYHKYVGHDNNRDFVGLTQEDTRAIARIYNLDWFPQVMIEKHQMGSTGIRYFVPPSHDPIAENVDAELWTWTGIFGTNMLRDLTNAGLSGVGQKTIFDDYWPGSTETCIWKNVIGMLTEAASAREASPVFIEPGELQVSGKGLSEYEKSINFPLPWPGGWWRLGDIVKLEIESTLSIIKTASLQKNDILKFRNDLCKREVEKGKTQPPYYYVVPQEQADQSELISLVELMKEQGINTFQLSESYTLNGINLRSGDIVYPLAQPFRAFIKEVMEKQEFPVRHYTPGGDVIRPYDVTSWSLPLHRGLVSYEIRVRDAAFEATLKPLTGELNLLKETYNLPAIFPVTSNGSFKAAFIAMQNGIKVGRLNKETKISDKLYGKGSFVIQGDDEALLNRIVKESRTEPGFVQDPGKLLLSAISMPRIALIETYFSDIDAGWTRYLFDSYKLPYTIIHPDEFEKTDFTANFDIVIIPSSSKALLMNGKPGTEDRSYMSNYHPDYQKGMGKKGFEKLLVFINEGGKVISWEQSAELFTGMLEITKGETKEEFMLPFANVSDQARKDGLLIPGSLIRVHLKQDHPLTYGMPNETGVFYRDMPFFSTSIPRFDMDRRIIGVFPEKNILISGYCENEEKIANKAAMIWLKKGKGELVLFAFNPQFRASTQATYKLLFNALFPFPVE